MKYTYVLVLVLGCWVSENARSQTAAVGTVFGIKGGGTLATQNWGGLEMDPLYTWHAVGTIESWDAENKNTLFMDLGYHVKGSALRNRNFFDPFNNLFSRPPAQKFEFYNASLAVGFKRKYPIFEEQKFYYLLAVRGDVNINTNLDQYEEFNLLFPSYALFPVNDYNFIQRFSYGFTLGGGVEHPLTDNIETIVEVSFHPDMSNQYRQPAIPNLLDPFTNTPVTLPERRIRNLAVELSVGFRFIRKVIYTD